MVSQQLEVVDAERFHQIDGVSLVVTPRGRQHICWLRCDDAHDAIALNERRVFFNPFVMFVTIEVLYPVPCTVPRFDRRNSSTMAFQHEEPLTCLLRFTVVFVTYRYLPHWIAYQGACDLPNYVGFGLRWDR